MADDALEQVVVGGGGWGRLLQQPGLEIGFLGVEKCLEAVELGIVHVSKLGVRERTEKQVELAGSAVPGPIAKPAPAHGCVVTGSFRRGHDGVGSALLSGLFTPLAPARQQPLNVYTIIARNAKHAHIKISFNPVKRDKTLRERGLDFEDAPEVFAGVTVDRVDDRFDYGEERIVTVGWLAGRMVVVVWTIRGDIRHIISWRKANEREQKKYQVRLGRS